jgi:UDP-3-O-[3-hydroxymyristoyl] glucosamine N-acyltransferase
VERLLVPVTVADVAGLLKAPFEGAGDKALNRLATLDDADDQALSFVAGRRYGGRARQTAAGALLVAPELRALCAPGAVRIVVDDPYVAYARVSQWWAQRMQSAHSTTGIHPTAVIDASARIGEAVVVAAGVHIGPRAIIGARCVLGPGTVVGEAVELGEDSRLVAQVTLYHGVRVGARALIHAGVVIGADGFGFAPSAEGFVKIAQLGSVRIGDDVEIGANCAIDRGAIDDTVIGDGVKIDNLVQVGHNVRIGAHSVVAGCAGIAGSAVIGERCMIGGGVGVAGHIQVCDGAVIGGFSLVERSVTEPGFYTGAWPLQPHVQWERTAATLKQLPQLRQRLRALAQKLGVFKDHS